MTVPHFILINDIKISVFALFILFSVVAALYIFWRETKRDGFDEELAFDMFLVAGVSGFIFGRLVYALLAELGPKGVFWHLTRFWTGGVDLYGVLFGVLLTVFLLCRLWRWSIYRLLDITALSMLFGLALLSLAQFSFTNTPVFLVNCLLFVFLYGYLQKLRLRVRSGMVFFIFVLACLLLSITLFFSRSHLPFYLLLFTIGVVTMFLRERKNPMKMKLSLPKSYLEKMKKRLRAQDKQLAAEQELLIKEDPYFAPGRTESNEYLDDVAEDIDKEGNELSLSRVRVFRMQVRKALARIKLGKYGLCEVCGDPIGKARLDAYPEATTCVKHSS